MQEGGSTQVGLSVFFLIFISSSHTTLTSSTSVLSHLYFLLPEKSLSVVSRHGRKGLLFEVTAVFYEHALAEKLGGWWVGGGRKGK